MSESRIRSIMFSRVTIPITSVVKSISFRSKSDDDEELVESRLMRVHLLMTFSAYSLISDAPSELSQIIAMCE